MTTVYQTAEGLLARDGKVIRYKLRPNKLERKTPVVQGMADHTGESKTDAFSPGCFGYGTEDMLFDDEFVINDPEMGPQAIISPINEWPQFRGLMITPWQPRFLNEHAFLDHVRFGITQYNARYEVKRHMEFDSGRITLVYSGTEYYVDEDRGYIPRKALYVHGASSPRTVIALFTEAEYVEGKGWFPMKWVSVSSPPTEAGVVKCSVMELRVTELTLGRPAAELLTLKVSQGRHFIDQTNLGKLKQLVVEKDMDVRIEDVAKLVDRYRNPTNSNPTDSEAPRKLLWRRVVLVACGIVVAAVIGYAYYRGRCRMIR